MNSYGPDLTTCTPICGDGYIVGIEKCDDKNKSTTIGNGCNEDCSGNYSYWYCQTKAYWN